MHLAEAFCSLFWGVQIVSPFSPISVLPPPPPPFPTSFVLEDELRQWSVQPHGQQAPNLSSLQARNVANSSI